MFFVCFEVLVNDLLLNYILKKFNEIFYSYILKFNYILQEPERESGKSLTVLEAENYSLSDKVAPQASLGLENLEENRSEYRDREQVEQDQPVSSATIAELSTTNTSQNSSAVETVVTSITDLK